MIRRSPDRETLEGIPAGAFVQISRITSQARGRRVAHVEYDGRKPGDCAVRVVLEDGAVVEGRGPSAREAFESAASQAHAVVTITE